MTNKKLLMFVCTGNMCRSPMAEFMLRDKLLPDSEWVVCSAGVAAAYGVMASQAAIRVLEENGINLNTHLSRPVEKELVEEASLVIVMTQSHLDQMRQAFPASVDKMFLMKDFGPSGGGEVDDPVGMSDDVYRRVYKEMEEALPDIIKRMQSDTSRGKE